MRALIVGLGSAGRRHVRNLRHIDPTAKIAVWRRMATPLPTELDDTISHVCSDERQVLQWRPDVAIIAAPAPHHVDAALTLARAGVHLLIEKPLSDDLDGVSDLLGVCEKESLTLLVGYNLCFDPVLRSVHAAVGNGAIGRVEYLQAEVGQYLPNWRPWADY